MPNIESNHLLFIESALSLLHQCQIIHKVVVLGNQIISILQSNTDVHHMKLVQTPDCMRLQTSLLRSDSVKLSNSTKIATNTETAILFKSRGIHLPHIDLKLEIKLLPCLAKKKTLCNINEHSKFP